MEGEEPYLFWGHYHYTVSLNPTFLKQHIVYIVVLAIMLGPGCYLPFKKKLGRTVLDT
jgi:hypothetical protein